MRNGLLKGKKRYIWYLWGHLYIEFADGFPGKGTIRFIGGKRFAGIVSWCDEMKILKFVKKCWRGLKRPGRSTPPGIDSHKWESKIEILRQLSNKHY